MYIELGPFPSEIFWPLLKGSSFAKINAPDFGRQTVTIRDDMKKKYGGNWFVLACQADEFCSYTSLPNSKRLTVKVTNGQSVWFFIAKLS